MNNYANIESYDSVQEYVKHVLKIDKEQEAPGGRASRKSARPSWANLSYQDTVRRATTTAEYPELIDKLEEIELPDLDSDRHDTLRPGLQRGVVGFLPNVPAYLAGVPDNMYTRVPAKNAKRYVRVGVHLHSQCDVSAKERENYGAALLSAITALSLQGVAVELLAVDALSNRNGNAHSSWTEIMVKRADQDWSPAQAAFIIGEPSFARRFGFMHIENTECLKANCEGGYGDGHGCRPPEGRDFDVWFGYFLGGRDYKTKEKAFTHIMGHFNEYIEMVKETA